MPKKYTGSSFADYMMRREKMKSDLLAELSRAKTPAEKETVSRKIKGLSPAPLPHKRDAPPRINPDEYDPTTGGIDTARNNKPVTGGTQEKSPVSSWRNPDEVDPQTGGLDTNRNDKPVKETNAKSPVSTWRNPDEADPYAGGLRESGSRNTVSNASEVIADIRDAIKSKDVDTMHSKVREFLVEISPGGGLDTV